MGQIMSIYLINDLGNTNFIIGAVAPNESSRTVEGEEERRAIAEEEKEEEEGEKRRRMDACIMHG